MLALPVQALEYLILVSPQKIAIKFPSEFHFHSSGFHENEKPSMHDKLDGDHVITRFVSASMIIPKSMAHHSILAIYQY